jgi:signal peptidase I
LRRWQVVAFNDPGVPRQLTVKRIVGLPGEQVSIHGGDVYLDGRLARKNLAEQRELAVLVHDNDFRPRSEARLPPRWQADAPHSRWRANAGGFLHRFASPGEGDEGPSEEEPTENRPPIDWLTYRQWRCVVRPPRTAEAPVRDSYGYNQGVPRHLQEATDLMLVCRVTLSGPGGFVLRCDNGRETIAAVLEPAQDRLTVLQGAKTIATADLPGDLAGRPIELVFSVFDRQVIVAIDGEAFLTKPLAPSDAPFTPTSRPLAIGARGVDVTIESLQIYRDLYYLDPLNQGVSWEADARLAADELFVLGDNAPISRDSRVFPRPLKQADVVGGVLRFAATGGDK